MASTAQAVKKPYFTSRPTELEQISRPHLEFTADSAEDSSPRYEKTEFDYFADELDEAFDYFDFEYQERYSKEYELFTPCFRSIMPYEQRYLRYVCNQHANTSEFPPDITSLIDWSAQLASYNQVEIVEASQSIDIKAELNARAALQDERNTDYAYDFYNGMFDTEPINQDALVLGESAQDKIEWQQYNEHWMKFYHFPKPEYYLVQQEFKSRPLPRYRKASSKTKADYNQEKPPSATYISKTTVPQQIAEKYAQNEKAVKYESPAQEVQEHSTSANVHLQSGLSTKKPKFKKRPAKVKQPCTCTYIPYQDQTEQIGAFGKKLQDIALFPIKLVGYFVVGFLFVASGFVYAAIKAVADSALFLTSLWQSRNFRLPVLMTLFMLPLVCSLVTLSIKTLLTINYGGSGHVTGVLDHSRILNYNFLDLLDRNYLPVPDVGNSLLEQLYFGVYYGKRVYQISNYQQLKYLSTELNNKFTFYDTECAVEYGRIVNDNTRLLQDDFRQYVDFPKELLVDNCAFIYSTDVYLAVPCSFQGPASPGTFKIDGTNIRSRVDVDNLTIYTLSDSYGNALRLVMQAGSEVYLRRHAANQFSFSDMFILSTGHYYMVQSVYYDKGVERLGNMFYQDITDKYFSIRLLMEHDSQAEITINITIAAVKYDIPDEYALFQNYFFEIFNLQMRNISYNFLAHMTMHADNTSLNYNYQNLKHYMVADYDIMPIELLRHYLQMTNWLMHSFVVNGDDGKMLRNDAYRYYYLIYNMYFHSALILFAIIFIGYCIVKVLFAKKSVGMQTVVFAVFTIMAAIGFVLSVRYLLAFYFAASLPEKLVICLVIIQFAEGSLYNTTSIRCLIIMLLIDHLQRVLDSYNHYAHVAFFACVVCFLHTLASKHSVWHFVRTSFEVNYFSGFIPESIPFYDQIFLRAIDHPACSYDSIIIIAFTTLGKVLTRFLQMFLVRKRFRPVKNIKKSTPKYAYPPNLYPHQKLPYVLLPSFHFVPELFPDSTAPWNVDVQKLNYLNCQSYSGYGMLQTNIRIVYNESPNPVKEKYLTLHPAPINVPTLKYLLFLHLKNSARYCQLFTNTNDAVLYKTTDALYLNSLHAMLLHPYSYRLRYLLLPSYLYNMGYLDISNITTAGEDTSYDEMCFFSTSLGKNYRYVVKYVTLLGKFFNYLAFPYLKQEKRSFPLRDNHYIYPYLGDIRQIAVYDAGYDSSQREPPVYSIIRDDFLPALTKCELVFIVAVFFQDSFSAGILPSFRVPRSYFERVSSELYLLYGEIVTELSPDLIDASTTGQVDIAKLVYLAGNTPLLSQSFYEKNVFGIHSFAQILLDNFGAILDYADSVAANPTQEHFSELTKALLLNPFFLPADPQNPRLTYLICIAHQRLLERRILQFIGYCLDVLTTTLMRQSGYALRGDSVVYQFVHVDQHRDPVLNENCLEACAEHFFETFKSGSQFSFSYLCYTCQYEFRRQIYDVLAKYEAHEQNRLAEIYLELLRECRCQEDVMAVLVNSGYVNVHFARQILRRETALLREARINGNQAARSARTCFVQIGTAKFAFNLRNTSEAIYSLLISQARSELAKRIGIQGKWKERARASQRAVLQQLCMGKRIRIVLESDKSIIADGVEGNAEIVEELGEWYYAFIL